jgi:electron transfer flavoprotein alpha subunit
MAILVLAEHDNVSLKPATQHVVTAAKKISEKGGGLEVHVLVIGENSRAVAEASARAEGVSRVFLANAPHLGPQTAEAVSAQVLQQVRTGKYSHVLAPATTFGKNVLPRVAACLDVQQISGIIEVLGVDTFVRPIYAGNALATVQSASDAIKILTVLSTGFDTAAFTEASAPIELVKEIVEDKSGTRLVGRQLSDGGGKIELTAAKVVVSGGRGLQKAENFKLLEALAAKLNAAVGASRAAVDAGYVPNDYQVGQTGKIVAPDLYIAVGISGAIQHLAGMRDSKVIVAINKDPDAPIFQVADYGLVGDALEILPQLTAQL